MRGRTFIGVAFLAAFLLLPASALDIDQEENHARELTEQGRYAEAAASWAALWNQVKDTAAADSAARARVMFRWAEAERLLGRPRRSLEILKQLGRPPLSGSRGVKLQSFGELWAAAPDGRVALLTAWGETLRALGEYDQAELNLIAAQEQLSAEGNAVSWETTVIARSLGEVHRLRGDYDSAAACFNAALDLRRRLPRPTQWATDAALASLYRSLGELDLERWRLTEAEMHLRHALAVDSSLHHGRHPDVGDDLEALAVLAWRRGRFAEARRLFAECEQVRLASLPDSHPVIAWGLSNRAEFLLTLGEAAAAEKLDEAALAILREALGPDHIEVAQVRYNLARARAALGRVDQALTDLNAALYRFYVELGERSEWTLEALGERARLLSLQRQHVRAIAMVRRVLKTREASAGKDDARTAEAAALLGDLLTRAGRAAEALPLIERALASARVAVGDTHPLTARGWWLKALAEADQAGDPQAGAESFRHYRAVMEDLLGPLVGDDGLRFAEYQRNLADWQERLLAAARRTQGAANQAALSEILEGEDQERAVRLRSGAIAAAAADTMSPLARLQDARQQAEALERELEERRRKGELTPELEWRLKQGLREKWLAAARLIEEEVAGRDSQVMRLLEIGVTAARSLALRLKPGEYYLRLASGDSRLLVFVVRNDGLVRLHEAPELHRRALSDRVAAIRKLASTPDGDLAQLRAEATRLYAEMFGPEIGKELATADTVHIVPSGALFYLPFELLVAEKGDTYAAWGLATAIDYVANPGKPSPPSSPGRDTTLIYANPSPMPAGLSPLPGAEVEAQLIARAARFAEVRTGAAASEGTLAWDLHSQKPRYLVLSTHAVAAPLDRAAAENMSQTGMRQAWFRDQSAIFLAPDQATGEDGRVTLSDLQTMQLDEPLDLVALSACQTAQGTVDAGDEVMNLAEAFREMGAIHVVATLWPVHDEASTRLMSNFFRELSAGKSEVDALQSAKRRLTETAGGRFSHPVYWAGYILYRPAF